MAEDIRLRAVMIAFLLIILVSVGVDMLPDSTIQTDTKPVTNISEKLNTDEIFAKGVKQLREGQYQNAISSFRNVLKKSPRMPEAYTNIGFAHFGLKHYSLAAESFTTALDLNSSQLNAYWGLAISLEGLCDIPAAMGAMRTYVHLAQKDDPYLKKARAAIWEWEQVKATASGETGEYVDCQKKVDS